MTDFKFQMSSVKTISKSLCLGNRGKAQRWLDAQLAQGMDRYVPFREGTLANSVNKSRFGSGRLVYDTVYARRQYYAGRKPHTDPQRPMAGVFWAKRYWEANRGDVCRRLQSYMRKLS